MLHIFELFEQVHSNQLWTVMFCKHIIFKQKLRNLINFKELCFIFLINLTCFYNTVFKSRIWGGYESFFVRGIIIITKAEAKSAFKVVKVLSN